MDIDKWPRPTSNGASIQEISKRFKLTFFGRDTMLLFIILGVGISSFWLGRMSTEPIGVRADASTSVVRLIPSEPTDIEVRTPSKEAEMNERGTSAPLEAIAAYVASKNGTKYHLPWCPGAQAIKEENKLWFDTKEEAEAAGYAPAANCKGI
jgi:hypothetical protein